ncbi:hypothetical protein AXG93_436s1050 [Marchantia polymorpha subsp. ruderalis]|uniref:Uncharacterized protein n=1 Tax=Marchantia polymorpha subsp. ruderalis TaxID=1480154 RepID=A0A176VEP9_MARPO|nr:hypothetical protein AXG93_436s1050 [Marchantia polymorpha subsp. ruderalis]
MAVSHTAVYLQNRSPSKALPMTKPLTNFGMDRSRICATYKFLDVLPLPILKKAIRASVVAPAEQEGFTPFRPIPLASSTDPIRRFLPPPILPAVREISPVTPSPAVGVPQALSTSSVNHTPTTEVSATYPARFGQTYQRRTWKLRENPLSSTPLVDTVRNLEHLLGELRLQDTTSEAPADHTATGAASTSSPTIDPILRRAGAGKEYLHTLPAPSILSCEGGKSKETLTYQSFF